MKWGIVSIGDNIWYPHNRWWLLKSSARSKYFISRVSYLTSATLFKNIDDPDFPPLSHSITVFPKTSIVIVAMLSGYHVTVASIWKCLKGIDTFHLSAWDRTNMKSCQNQQYAHFEWFDVIVDDKNVDAKRSFRKWINSIFSDVKIRIQKRTGFSGLWIMTNVEVEFKWNDDNWNNKSQWERRSKNNRHNHSFNKMTISLLKQGLESRFVILFAMQACHSEFNTAITNWTHHFIVAWY